MARRSRSFSAAHRGSSSSYPHGSFSGRYPEKHTVICFAGIRLTLFLRPLYRIEAPL